MLLLSKKTFFCPSGQDAAARTASPCHYDWTPPAPAVKTKYELLALAAVRAKTTLGAPCVGGGGGAAQKNNNVSFFLDGAAHPFAPSGRAERDGLSGK